MTCCFLQTSFRTVSEAKVITHGFTTDSAAPSLSPSLPPRTALFGGRGAGTFNERSGFRLDVDTLRSTVVWGNQRLAD